MSNKNFKTILKKSSLLAGAMALSFGIIALNFNGEDPYFSQYRGNYDSDLAYIKDATVPTNNKYITMTQAAGGTVPGTGQKVSIATFEDLILFSETLNDDDKSACLGYDYELIANIQCDGLHDFAPVGYKTGHPFSGKFNGNGYEIIDLQFENNVPSGMSYYSMFSVNTGTIENVGLSYPSIVISSPTADLMSVGGVSYLVGKNEGTVKNSFVIDDSNGKKKDTSGITANESRIATLCVDNSGTLDNNYVAIDLVVDSQSTYAEFAELTLTNNGSIEQCIYFNNSISMISGSRTVYKDSTGLPDKTTSAGSYALAKEELITYLADRTGDRAWYTSSSYGDLAAYVPIAYGIRRGLTYNNSTLSFTVANDKDYAYMYELFNSDDYLASNRITYNITADIDLKYQPVASYTYKKGIGASIIGATISGSTKLITNNMSTSPTIYNAKVMDESRIAKSVGVDCYGLFNFVTGTIKNLNVYAGDISLNNISTSSNNVKGVGILAGYIESGHIENVNVYGEIKKNNSSDIKEYYLGGITGILGGAGVIMNSTAAGSIELVAMTTTIGAKSAYMKGVAIGGIAGYLESSLGNVYGATSAVDISTMLGASVDYAIGGIIGAGYTTNYNYVDSNDYNQHNKTANLENLGDITVGDSTHKTYSTLYVSGIIGRHLGATAQVENFNNAGVITVCANANDTYVSGVENVDFKSSAVDNTGMTASQYKDKAGKTIFYASSLTNGNNVIVSNNSSVSNNLNYTNVINIKAGNGVVSQVQGLFNLSYNKQYNTSGNKVSGAIDAQAININLIKNFAPVLNVVGGTSTYTTTASMVYNLRDVTFDTSANVTTAATYKYVGVALGDYVSYKDVRNEGKLTFTLDNTFTSNLIVSGLFDVVSPKMTANNLYNSGNIDIDYTANVTGNIYASGICYKNESGFTDTEIAQYNPSSDTYDNTKIGSINNAINKGAVKVNNSNYSTISYKYYWYRHNNTNMVVANVVYSTYTGSYLTGDINVAGIVAINESVITNAFNIASVKALNYVKETSQNNTNEINAGGIATLNIGKHAYIENSANDGDVIAVNLSSYTYTTTSGEAQNHINGSKSGMITGSTQYYSDVNAGGIVSRNDKKENENGNIIDGSNNNSKQVISFTINYGSVYAYNYAENGKSPSTSVTTKAAGIIASGLCNVINVLNYAEIGSGNTGAGIFGLVSLELYSSEITGTNKVYIANTINYGNIYSIKHSYDKFELAIPSGLLITTDSEDNNHPTYQNFISGNFSGLEFIPNNSNYSFSYFVGSIIGIIDYNSDTNAKNIVIRYLVSFYDALSISGSETNVTDGIEPNVDTIYSPYLQASVGGWLNRDDYLATNVQYAPVSSDSVTGDFAKTNSESGGKEKMTFYGVFNEEFTFRKVIENYYKDGSKYYNTSTYKTDRFLTDFFQFIPYSYVNDNLMKKIGWKTSAYLDAANRFANSLEGNYCLYTSDNGISTANYNTDLTAALSTATWSKYANPEILKQLVEKLMNENDTAGIKTFISYIFSEENDNSKIFTSTLRGEIVEYVYNNYRNLIDTNELIDFTNGYSRILANALCSDASNEIKDSVTGFIAQNINDSSDFTKAELLTAYINYLKDDTGLFFTKTSNLSKYYLLQTLFDGIDSENFYTTLLSLFSSEDQQTIRGFTDTLSGYGGFLSLSNKDKIDFFTTIFSASNNTNARIDTYLKQFASEIGLFDYLREDGYDESSFDSINSNIAYTTTNNTSSEVIDARVKLWNRIRETSTFKAYFKNLLGNTKKYYLATEKNNTYQTDSAPVSRSETTTTMNNFDNPNVLGSYSDLNFIYTETITPNTYFYGPYANSSGTVTSSTKIPYSYGTDEYMSSTSQGSVVTGSTYLSSNLYYTGYDYVFGNNGTSNYYAVFLSNGALTSSQKNSIKSVATGSTGITSASSPLITFRRTETNSIDNAKEIFAELQRNNLTYRTINTEDYIIDAKGNRQTLGYVTINRPNYTSNTFVLGGLTIDSGTKYTVYYANGSVRQANATGWDFILENYVYNITMNTVTTSWHSTGRTGIYIRFDIAYTGNYRRIGRNYYDVYQIRYNYDDMFTTRYIDYNADQILDVDGKLSKYSTNPNYVSNDEKDIINKVFNEILLTSANRNSFLQIVSKSLLESLGTDRYNSVHVEFIENFIANGVTTSKKVNDTTEPLKYLYCIDENTQKTIAAYLETLSDNSELKGKILTAASNNKTIFVELLDILFNKSLVVGADTTYNPDTSPDYGASFNVADLKTRMVNKLGNTNSIKANQYLPFVGSNSDATTTSDRVYSGTNIVGQSANQLTNIGYFTGDSIVASAETIAGSIVSNKFFSTLNQEGNDGSALASGYIRQLNDSTVSDEVWNATFNLNATTMTLLQLQKKVDINNNLVTINNAYVGGVKYNSIKIPKSVVWVKPQQVGTMKFVMVSTDSEHINFTVRKFKRNTFGDLTSSMTGLTDVIDATKGTLKNGESNIQLVYTEDMSSSSSNTYTTGFAFYFEVTITEQDIAQGYEFVLDNDRAQKGAYFWYLDLGQNGATGPSVEDKTYYVQDTVSKGTNYNIDDLISYLTPLDATNREICYAPTTEVDADNYSNYYLVAKATTFSDSTTYYAKDGDNYVRAKNVTVDNVTDYYVISSASSYDDSGVTTYYKKYLVSDYQTAVFNTEFMKMLAKSSNDATCAYINSIDDSTALVDILKYIVGKDSRFFDSIITKGKTTTLSNDYKKWLTSGYLATEYYKVYQTNMASGLFYTRINGLNDDYKYILSASTIDTEKLDALWEAIGYPESIKYGIFALASNEGIKNGVFIPDNLDITKMDDAYSYETIDGKQILTLDDNPSNEWRGGNTASESDKTTVNYAFIIDMKQVKKSISTAVFEFDINYGGATLYGDINVNAKTITFYVPTITTGDYQITNAEFAYKATSTKSKGNTISVSSNTATGGVQDTFIVTAEDTRVTATYKVIFKTVDVNFTLTYSDESTTKTEAAFTNDSTLVLTLKSVDDYELPTGLNLAPYISFVGTGVTYKPGEENGYISLSASSVDHVVDANGDATITLIVSPKLPYGTYAITVEFATISKSVSYKKEASSANAITAIQYQGQDLTWSSRVATSEIPFGRAFNYTDLTAIYIDSADTTVVSTKTYYVKTGTDVFSYKKVSNPVNADINTYYELNEDFYLNKFEVSYNATVALSATYEIDNTTGLMTYSVSIVVTSETKASVTYTHKLVEKNYFEDATYANLYADGDDVNPKPANYSSLSESDRVIYLYDGTFTYDHTKDDFTGAANSSLADTMKMHITFNRGVEPQYRVKYVLNNFYTLGENVVFGPTDATSNNGATVNNTYAGLTVTVSNNNEVGKYTFVYKYTNTGMWSDGEYTRYYEFPELIIEKLASTDALLKKITFLEEAVSLGNTATVILPNKVLVPSMSDTTVGYSDGDTVYSAAFGSSSREINVTHTGIEYGTSDSTDISDYFVIGTVSNADLSYYCPTFGIESHAQMYQYTTLEKLTEYGTGVQTKKDKAILTNHSNMYLYVPFTSSESHEIFLVQLDNSGNWTNVYRTTFNGTNADSTVNGKAVTVGTFASGINAKNAKGKVVAGYTVCDYAGNPTNNDSLYMDYVGTPLDGHFWYVSYVIFSEDKLEGGTLAGNVRYYHISVIDLTNNIQFYVKVYAPSDFDLTDIYLTISENLYDKSNTKTGSRQISAYAVDHGETATRSDINGYKIYTLGYDLQTLPGGYFYFYVDLPDGYVAKSYTSMKNRLEDTDPMASVEDGAFLPFESIITQKVYLEIIINKGTGVDDSDWAISTSDIFIEKAIYTGTILTDSND